MIFSVLFLVAAAIAFFEFVQPEYTNFATLLGQQQGEQAALKTTQQLVTQVQAALSAYQSQASGAQSVNLAMPIGADSSEALAQIYGLAANTGISVQSVGVSFNAPQAQATVQTAAGSGSTVSLASLTKSKGSISFDISAVGSYESMKTFLQGLESNVRLFDVTSLSVRPASSLTNPTGMTTQDLFLYNITADTYYQSS